jgi:hypothetical protein
MIPDVAIDANAWVTARDCVNFFPLASFAPLREISRKGATPAKGADLRFAFCDLKCLSRSFAEHRCPRIAANSIDCAAIKYRRGAQLPP